MPNVTSTGLTVLKLKGETTTINSQSIIVDEIDENGDVTRCHGTVAITAGGSGYAKSCLYRDTDVVTGTAAMYENIGTNTSCDFNLIGAVSAGEISLATGSLLIGTAGVASAVAMSGDATIVASGAVTIANSAITTAKIADSNVTLGKLAAGITPSHIVRFAGTATWSGSGATLAHTVTGVAATDIVTATVKTKATEASYLVAATPTTDTITFELSAANTSNDAVIMYSVARAAA